MSPILLLVPTPEKSSNNDASVAKYIHAPPYLPGPYSRRTAPSTLPYLPSLAWFCLTKLAQAVDQVSAIGDIRLNYQPPASEDEYDLLRALMPSFSLPEFDWASVDPRLWATIVQIYDNLPPDFQLYEIPLADTHLPLLQRIKSTAQFSLITILELPSCRELLDTTVVNLKHLHSLCALDASATDLTTYGLKILSGTVQWGEDQTRKGPWGLRILRLRNCRAIDNKILPHLSPFLLLSILDLRGTQCRSDSFFPTFQPAPSEEHTLYHPTPLRLSVALLSSACGLFSSPNVFTLYINTLHHTATAERPATQQTHLEDIYVTFNSGSSGFVVGPSEEAPKPPRRVRRFAARERKPKLEECLCPECTTGGSHPRRKHMSTPLDFALHDRIAEQEISQQQRRQDIMSFYRSTTVAQTRNSFRGYAYPPEAPLPPSEKDAKLMLYRPPPAWAALEATAPDVHLPKPTGLPEVVIGLSKRKRVEMAEYMEQLNEKRRKMQEHNATAGPTVPVHETVSLSRNPFRRKDSKQSETPGSIATPSISRIAAPVLSGNVGGDGTDMRKPEAHTSTSRSCGREDLVTHDRERNVPRKSAFDWNRWGKK